MALAGAAVSAGAQDWADRLGGLLAEGAEWVEAIRGGEVEFYWPGEDDLAQFWSGLGDALHDEELDRLAALSPLAHRVLDALDRIDGARPYADWLRQRIDYLEVAEEAVRRSPPLPPSPPPAPPGTVASTPTPPLRSVPRPVPAAVPRPDPVRKQRVDWVGEQARWRERIRGRPPPARAEALVPGLKRVFAAGGIPAELVWLAEVESSFNPDAKSPAGAVGLYQFMPATAAELGLQLAPRDERRMPEKSATAAANYLRQLYLRFDSWPLALASYNAGPGRVGGLLRRHQATTFDEIAPHLPNETRMYVPKVLATVAVREGIDAARLPPAVRALPGPAPGG